MPATLSVDKIKTTVRPLAEKYNLSEVVLFGSYASGKATEKSDVDFLVKFNTETPSIFKVMGFKEELACSLENSVDVVTLPLLRPEKLNIKEVVNIYERA
ncbi:MAG: nucleotidyltransferase domain-containing protein [Oscillospiraceae bacterium]|nr:nucleotidyltransferase domain-containing protein [Oscillospiraceae bacterium]